MTTLDFETIVPSAQAGDKAAQDALMTGFYGWSVTIVRQTIRDTEEAHNVVVDFWGRLFQEGLIQEYRGGVPFMTWMRTKLRNAASRFLRDKREPRIAYAGDARILSDAAPDEGGAPEDFAYLAELVDLLEARLPRRHQDVLWRLIEGATAEEIAEELGVAESRARSIIAAVRRAVREVVE